MMSREELKAAAWLDAEHRLKQRFETIDWREDVRKPKMLELKKRLELENVTVGLEADDAGHLLNP